MRDPQRLRSLRTDATVTLGPWPGIPRETRALRWHNARDVRLETVPLPVAGPGDVVVRVAYCGICPSDLHEVDAGPTMIPVGTPHPLSGSAAPVVLGHEFSGTVVSAGPDAGPFLPGDRVAVEPNYKCGVCPPCEDGDYNVCDSWGLIGMTGDGGLTDHAVVPGYMLHRLPSGFDLRKAALLEPAAVALHAIRLSSLAPGMDALVVGLGPIGLLACRLLRLRGVNRLFGIDPVPERRELAVALGADAAFPPGDDALRAVRDETGGRGVRVAFEAAGSQAATDTAFDCLDRRGEMMLIGLVPELRVAALSMVGDQQRLIASSCSRDCYPELIGLISSGALDPSVLISEVVDLADAVELLQGRTGAETAAVKTLIRCAETPTSAASSLSGREN